MTGSTYTRWDGPPHLYIKESGSGSTGWVAVATGATVIPYTQIQDVTATNRLLGRSTAGAGDIEEIPCTSFARTLLDDADAATARTTLGVGAGGGDMVKSTYDPNDDGVIALAQLDTAVERTTNKNAANGYAGLDANSKLTFSAVPIAYARVTGSDATTTGQTLVDITGLSLALLANATYEFEAVLSVTTSAVTTGCQYGIQFSGAGASVVGQLIGSSTSTAAKSERIAALNTASGTYLTTSAQNGQIYMRGVITVGANAGNLTCRHLKVTSGTSTVRINSFLKCTRIV